MTDFHDRRDGRVKPPHVIAREAEQRRVAAAPYKVVKGKGAVHIDGIGPRGSYGKNAGNDTGQGYVSYAPESSCAGLTRLGAFRSTLGGHDDLNQALAQQQSGVHGSPCATCAKNAKLAMEG